MDQEQEKKSNYLAFKFSNKKIKPWFVTGGDWTLLDKSAKENIFKRAKKENYDHFENQYRGVAIARTRDVDEYDGYAFFREFPKDARSLALMHAIAVANEQLETGSRPNVAIVRFFHIRDDNGQEVVWVTVIVDDVVRDDRIIDQMSSFQEENDLRAEYGEIDFKRYELDSSMQTLEEMWLSSSRKQQAQSKILSFAGAAKKLLVLAGLLAVLVAGALYGWNMWQEKLEEERLIQEKLDQEAEAARLIEALKRSEFPPVWIHQPSSPEYFRAVNDIIEKTPLVLNGWDYAGISFSVDEEGKELAAQVAYKRDANAPFMTPPGRISIQKPFQTLVTERYKFPKHERKAGIMKRRNAEMWLLEMSLGKPYQTAFELRDSPSKSISIGSREVEIVAAYQTINVDITNLEDLSGLGEVLDAPGFVIDNLSQTGDKWRLNGTLYVLP